MNPEPVRPPQNAVTEPPPAVAGGLISHFSHSLRTPLNSILGYAQILALDRAEPLSAVQRERVERIQQAGWQLAKLIDEIVELARIEAARADPSLPPGAAAAAAPDPAPAARPAGDRP